MTDRGTADAFARFMTGTEAEPDLSVSAVDVPTNPAPDRSQGADTYGPGKQDPARAFTEHLKNQLWRQGRRSGF